MTVAPTSTDSPETVPARCAWSGCSIFIASITTIGSPSVTSSPFWAATFTIVPCIGAVSADAPPPDGAAWPDRPAGPTGGPRLTAYRRTGSWAG